MRDPHDHPRFDFPLTAPALSGVEGRNFLGSPHERWTDARMLDLNHWPNSDCYQSEHPDARPVLLIKNPERALDRPKPASARNFLGNRILTPQPRIFSSLKSLLETGQPLPLG